MAIVEQTADGRTRIIQDGRWRDATPEEIEILEQGAVSATGSAAASTGRSLGGLLEFVASFAPTVGRGIIPQSDARDAARQEMRQRGLDRLVSSGEEIEELERLRPGPAFAGQVLTEGLTELATGGLGIKSLATRGARRAAREAAEETAERGARGVLQIADEAPTGVADNVINIREAEELGGVLESLPESTVGAQTTGGVMALLGRSKTMKALLEKIETQLGSARPITPDQQALIDGNVAERLGFEFLPGQKEGNNAITELVNSQPFMADAFDPVIRGNAERGGDLIREALGLPPGPLTRNTFTEADELFQREFENFAGEIRPAALPDELRTAIDTPDMLTTKDRRVFRVTESGEPISGERLLNLRSKLNRSLASARRSDQGVLADEILEQMDALDDVIKGSIEGGGSGPAWQRFMDTRQRWRVNLAFNRPGSFTPDGNFSVKRFSNSLERTFEREYRKRLLQRNEAGEVIDAQMPAEVADLLDFMRLGRTFASNMGDSGTASRLAIAQILEKGPSALIKQRLAAKFITDVMLNRPAAAAALP